MKHTRTRFSIELPDDVGIDIAMISTCCAVGFAALIYLLVI